MPNLDLVAVIKAKPGSESTVQAALLSLVEPSRKEPGCLAYDIFASESAPGTFVSIERWKSQEDIDAHMASPHLAEAIAGAGSGFDGMPALHTLRRLSS
jgi:quinol monooxygenase YgiN